ncbi:GTP 3',8-cyclase [Candidatus Magnetaquicoccaceae bacterium FCR-1]|uniref:GTP 3',8-cyclase n=1 Tax=Candidatus Magnetaquiglobus chichijimensis TaxID=3141448 RepID=A0ABQ0CBE2_9PROT
MRTIPTRLESHPELRRRLCAEAKRRGGLVLPYAPLEIFVDPTNICDLRCTFCPQSNWGERQRGFMSMELFERVIAEVAVLKPRQLKLFCYGETLLHPQLPEMIHKAEETGVPVIIHTNAKRLDEEMARRILDTPLSEICFSFDTADRDLYNRMRIRSDFDRVLGNIRRFLTLRQERGASRPQVILQEIIPFAPDKPCVNTPEYRQLFDGFDVRLDVRFLHSFAGASTESQFETMRLSGTSPCHEIYHRLVIAFDGKVHACCLDPEGHNIIGDLAAGDTITSAWNSPAMQRLRHLTQTGGMGAIAPCNQCHMLHHPYQKRRRFWRRIPARLLWWWYTRSLAPPAPPTP